MKLSIPEMINAGMVTRITVIDGNSVRVELPAPLNNPGVVVTAQMLEMWIDTYPLCPYFAGQCVHLMYTHYKRHGH